jgi:hypothetical protein
VNDLPPRIVAIPLNVHELVLVRRAVEDLIDREGESTTARNVREMLEAPLEVGQLAMLSDEEVFA